MDEEKEQWRSTLVPLLEVVWPAGDVTEGEESGGKEESEEEPLEETRVSGVPSMLVCLHSGRQGKLA